MLRAAAVTGRRVDDELVRRASGLAAPEYEEAVREAVAHQLLVPDGEQGYAFRHALLREAIYADLLPGERTRLHARLAELLADEARLAEVPGTAAELAHHCLASHDIPGAFAASVRAGRGGRAAGRAGRGAPALRPGAVAVGAGQRAGEAGRDEPRQAGLPTPRSAPPTAATSPAAVHQLRRLLGYLGRGRPTRCCSAGSASGWPTSCCDLDEDDAAAAAAEAAVDALPADPPRWERARALATHARALLSMQDRRAPRASSAEQAQGGGAGRRGARGWRPTRWSRWAC